MPVNESSITIAVSELCIGMDTLQKQVLDLFGTVLAMADRVDAIEAQIQKLDNVN